MTTSCSGYLIAIETTGLRGSIALAQIEQDQPAQILVSEDLATDRRSAQSLAPALTALLDSSSLTSRDIACVAVTEGPGSFTGLRVGITTAKSFAYAVGAKLIGVNTLAALAEPHNTAASPIWSAIDAQRSEVFVAKIDDPYSNEVVNQRFSVESFIESLPEGATVVSPMAERLISLAKSAGKSIQVVSAEPKGDAVARIGSRHWIAGNESDLFGLKPDYCRLSAAEENYQG